MGQKLLWFLNTSLKSAPQYNKFLPGATPPAMAPDLYRTAPKANPGIEFRDAEKGIAPATRNAEKLISLDARGAMAQGIMFAGNPDSVYRQIMNFYNEVGGFGHLVLVGRTGYITHEESQKSIRLFSTEVLPRLRAIAPVEVG